MQHDQTLSAKGVACETTPGSPPECLKAVKQKWHAQAETTIKFRKYVLQQEYDDPSVFRFSKKKNKKQFPVSVLMANLVKLVNATCDPEPEATSFHQNMRMTDSLKTLS